MRYPSEQLTYINAFERTSTMPVQVNEATKPAAVQQGSPQNVRRNRDELEHIGDLEPYAGHKITSYSQKC